MTCGFDPHHSHQNFIGENMKKILAIALLSLTLVSCTDNQNAALYGGTTKIDLPPGEKLENITWKTRDMSVSLWYLTTKRDPSEAPKTHTFKESSSYGVMQGKVIIVEH